MVEGRACEGAVRAACIDIGSNTTRLLVSEWRDGRLVEVHQERAFTRIGHELADSGTIGAEKIAEVVEVVDAQSAAARRQGADRVVAVATAAIRAAGNGASLTEAVSRRTGLAVKVLSGEEEARLAFRGATGMLAAEVSGGSGAGRAAGPREPLLGVVDVGGGSCELVVGLAPEQVCWWSSVAVGSGGLTDRCLCSDPPRPEELGAARDEVAARLAGLAPPRPRRAVAVGGGATSLARLAGRRLDAEALARSLALLTAEPAAAVSRRFEIDPQRARLLPAALLILEGVAALLATELTVGRGGIREGVLLELLRAGE